MTGRDSFFLPSPTADAGYQNVRDLPHLEQGKLFVESLWPKYQHLADPHFREDARNHFLQRFWEMYLACTLDERFWSDRIDAYIRKRWSGADTDALVRQAFEVLSGWMVFKEEPAHKRLRRLCGQAFTPKSIEALRARATSLTKELLDTIAVPSAFDLLASVAAPLPSSVIADDARRTDSRPRRIRTMDSQGLTAGLDRP